jgi:hypothetical protein
MRGAGPVCNEPTVSTRPRLSPPQAETSFYTYAVLRTLGNRCVSGQDVGPMTSLRRRPIHVCGRIGGIGTSPGPDRDGPRRLDERAVAGAGVARLSSMRRHPGLPLSADCQRCPSPGRH